MSSWAFAPPSAERKARHDAAEQRKWIFFYDDAVNTSRNRASMERPAPPRSISGVGARWNPLHRGPPAGNNAQVTPAYSAARSTVLNTNAGFAVRMGVLSERTYSQWPDDLKARWPRVRDELLAAIDRVQQAMKTFMGQVSLETLREFEAEDRGDEIVRPHRVGPYEYRDYMLASGREPLMDLANRHMQNVTTVDRTFVEGLYSVCANLTRILVEDANKLQLGAVDARELAAAGEPVNVSAVVTFDWMPAYNNFMVAKDLLRAVGTAPRALPYVRPRLPLNRNPRQRDDVYDSDEEIMATPVPQFVRPLVQAPIAEQAAREARIRRNIREGAPLVDWGAQPAEAAAAAAGKKQSIYGSAAGDFDPTAWLQRRVKIPRVPKVAGAAAADFDPTAWLQRRVRIPRQSPKAAQ